MVDGKIPVFLNDSSAHALKNRDFGIWIESYENRDALTGIVPICRDEERQLATSNIEAGLCKPGQFTLEDRGRATPL